MHQVGIVGYGAIGPIHAKALENVENATLVAVCDTDKKALERCAEQYPVKQFLNYEDILNEESIDTLHICTPHFLHYEMTQKALNKGKAVVLEKPITMTREQFQLLRARPNANRVCVVLQNRYNRCVKAMKEIVCSKALGRPLAAKAFLTWKRDVEYYGSGSWRGKKETEGGGVLINQAIHTLDYFTYLVGSIQSVSASIANLSLQQNIEVEDTVVARMKFNNGAIGFLCATNGYYDNPAPYFEMTFENGILRYQDRKLYQNGVLLDEDEAVLQGKPYWGSSHAELMRQYYKEGKCVTIKDATETMECLFAIYQSAAECGKEVTVMSAVSEPAKE